MTAPRFDDERVARRWRAAHRAALDHVLGLCTGQWWSDDLVLRGSMLLPAWLGAAARPPADLDWVVHRVDAPAPPASSYWSDREAPSGHLADLVTLCPDAERFGWPEAVAVWPEANRGERIRSDEEIEEPPPVDPWAPERPYGDLLELVARQPVAAGGVVLDAAEANLDDDWDHSGYDGGGQRLRIPWRAPGLPPGQVQLDFALDERLPEPPVHTLVPRADGGSPAVVLAVGRELSLAWKLRWLFNDGGWASTGWDDDEDDDDDDDDARSRPAARGKDLYDAVLLAEVCDGDRLPRLVRAVWGDEDVSALDKVMSWPVEWDRFRAGHPWVQGAAGDWLARLARHVPPARTIPPYSPIPERELDDLVERFNGARS